MEKPFFFICHTVKSPIKMPCCSLFCPFFFLFFGKSLWAILTSSTDVFMPPYKKTATSGTRLTVHSHIKFISDAFTIISSVSHICSAEVDWRRSFNVCVCRPQRCIWVKSSQAPEVASRDSRFCHTLSNRPAHIHGGKVQRDCGGKSSEQTTDYITALWCWSSK